MFVQGNIPKVSAEFLDEEAWHKNRFEYADYESFLFLLNGYIDMELQNWNFTWTRIPVGILGTRY